MPSSRPNNQRKVRRFRLRPLGFASTDAKVDASTKVTAAPIVRRHQGQDVALMAVGVGAMIAGL